MQKHIAIGDSLTAQDGHINYLKGKYQIDILNLAVGGGSNFLQFHRLRNLIFTNQIGPESILLWQIGSFVRPSIVMEKNQCENLCHGTPGAGMFDWFPCELDFYNDTQGKVFLLAHNDYFRYSEIMDRESSVQEFVSEVYLWSHIVEKIILYIGYTSDSDRESMLQINKFLESRPNIETTHPDLSIVNWCSANGKQLVDVGHPDNQGYIDWCQNVLEHKFIATL